MIRVQISGQRAAKRAVDQYGRDAGRAVTRALEATAAAVQEDAKRRAPVDLGDVRDSIVVRFQVPRGNVHEVEVAATAPHAQFVEFGTGPKGASSPLSPTAREMMREIGYAHGSRGGFPPLDKIRAWCARRGIDESAAFAIAFEISRNGTPAQPFLAPAVAAGRRVLPLRVATELRRVSRA